MQAGALLVALGAGYSIHNVSVNAQNGTTTTPPAQKAPVVATQATRDAAATQNPSLMSRRPCNPLLSQS